jgi:hypothetical protein
VLTSEEGESIQQARFFCHFLLTTIRLKLIVLTEEREIDKGGVIMKTMTVREGSRGRKTKVNAKKTFRDASGEWVVVVDGTEFCQACSYVCQGIKDCVWENLHVQADLDDDGKEYRVLSR